jgi:hypothetical protein
VGAVHDRERPSVLCVKKGDQGLVGWQAPVVVAGEHGDELGLQDPVEVARHRCQQPLRASSRDPRRHRRTAGAELDEGVGQAVEELVELEQLPDLSLRDD